MAVKKTKAGTWESRGIRDRNGRQIDRTFKTKALAERREPEDPHRHRSGRLV